MAPKESSHQWQDFCVAEPSWIRRKEREALSLFAKK
jgi:hypothetical protein